MAEWFDAPFWALVGLVIFFVLLVYLKVPGTLAGTLDKRAAAIRNELDEAQKLRKEAERLLADYLRRAKEAEGEAASIIEQARHEAKALAEEARTRTEEYVASRTKLAEEKIARAEAQAIQEVKALSADVAIAAAEKLLTGRVKAGAGGALVDKTIADVKSKLN